MSISALGRLRCEIELTEILGMVLIWLLLSVLTAGFAGFIYLYYAARLVVNRSQLLDSDGEIVGALKCELELTKVFGHALVWFLIVVVTFGLAAPVFFYKVLMLVVNNTQIVAAVETS